MADDRLRIKDGFSTEANEGNEGRRKPFFENTATPGVDGFSLLA